MSRKVKYLKKQVLLDVLECFTDWSERVEFINEFYDLIKTVNKVGEDVCSRDASVEDKTSTLVAISSILISVFVKNNMELLNEVIRKTSVEEIDDIPDELLNEGVIKI